MGILGKPLLEDDSMLPISIYRAGLGFLAVTFITTGRAKTALGFTPDQAERRLIKQLSKTTT